MSEARIRYWEDVRVDEELPGYSLLLDPLRLHLQSSGSQDLHRQHNDDEFARRQGAPASFVNTGFTQAAVGRVALDWMGDEGTLRAFRLEMRKMNHPGDTMRMHGRVVRKWLEDGLGYVECEVWAENDRAGITSPGRAVVQLPLRG